MAATQRQVREAQELLRKIGWPISVDGNLGPKTREAIEDFKRGFVIAPFQRLDGRLGPVTLDRIRYSAKRNGAVSPHFRFAEFRSKGNGWIKVHRDLVRGLEEYRRAAGSTAIVSGYRDPAHNKAVGGASSSQHMFATGADLNPKLTEARVRAMKRFSGIGIQRANGLVRHVDVRHLGPKNTTGGTPTAPTIWFYG